MDRTNTTNYDRPPARRPRTLLAILLGLTLLLVACDPERNSRGQPTLPDTNAVRLAALEQLIDNGEAIVDAFYVPPIPEHLAIPPKSESGATLEDLQNYLNDPYWTQLFSRLETIASLEPLWDELFPAERSSTSRLQTVGSFSTNDPIEHGRQAVRRGRSLSDRARGMQSELDACYELDPLDWLDCFPRGGENFAEDLVEFAGDLNNDVLKPAAHISTPGPGGSFRMTAKNGAKYAWSRIAATLTGGNLDDYPCAAVAGYGLIIGYVEGDDLVISVFTLLGRSEVKIPMLGAVRAAIVGCDGNVYDVETALSPSTVTEIDLMPDQGRLPITQRPTEPLATPQLARTWQTSGATVEICEWPRTKPEEAVTTDKPGTITFTWRQTDSSLTGTLTVVGETPRGTPYHSEAQVEAVIEPGHESSRISAMVTRPSGLSYSTGLILEGLDRLYYAVGGSSSQPYCKFSPRREYLLRPR